MKTRYPLFFWGFPLARTDLPVVIYHDVSIEAFARDLEFLRVNGYRTIGLDEFTVSGNRKAASRERRVLLTFDDARSSFYEAAIPRSTTSADGLRPIEIRLVAADEICVPVRTPPLRCPP
jgi:hypothetical protein